MNTKILLPISLLILNFGTTYAESHGIIPVVYPVINQQNVESQLTGLTSEKNKNDNSGNFGQDRSNTSDQANFSGKCPTPTVSISTAVQVCSGVPTTLSAVGSPSGGTYLWQPGNNSAQSISVTPTTTTLYTVLYTTSCGSVSDTVSVIVEPVPVLTVTAGITSGCPPFCVQFLGRNQAANVNITSWAWTFGDGTNASIQSPTHCYNNPGTYNVVLSAASSAGCSSTFQAPNFITVYPIPQAAFTYSPDPVTIDAPTVTFIDNSGGAYKIINWFWTFGDGGDTTISLQNPEHTYSDTGTFCPKLEVEDIHGCIDSTRQCLKVKSVYSFYIPSAFSPNGDGKNDVFLPQGTYVHSFDMYIFDRWGMQIFHSTNLTDGWNGGVNNGSKICQEDTYSYIINVTDLNNKSYHYTGSIYLIR